MTENQGKFIIRILMTFFEFYMSMNWDELQKHGWIGTWRTLKHDYDNGQIY